MIVPHQYSPHVQILTEESAARRPECTLGGPVRLADGETWWLPQIDYPFLLSRPELLAVLARTLDLASEVGQVETDLTRHAVASAFYHSQLVELVVVLLQENYDLPEGSWLRLVSFESTAELFALTLAVSEAVADSAFSWLPLCQASGHDRTENFLAN